MNSALWLLLWLQLWGWLRYLGRSLGTLRGALLALIGVSVFLPWLFAVLIGPTMGKGIDPEQMAKYGPAMLVAYCVVNVLFSTQERALYFSPAEVQFLFPGPFGRREILSYKLLLTILVSIPATLIMGMILRVREGWIPAMLLGLLCISMFMQLFSMALGLLANSLGEQLYSRGRKLAVGLMVLGLGWLVAQARGPEASWDLQTLGDELFQTQAWQVVSWPLKSYFDVMLARQLWPDLVVPLGIGLGVLVGLVGLIFALDAHYLEVAAMSSARTYARIQRMRGRVVGGDEAEGGKAKPRWEVPTLPYWGGVGPIFWRQLTSALRGVGRLLWILFILGAAIGAPIISSGLKQNEALLPSLVGVGVWLSVFLTTIVPFDFRGDIDRMDILKTLPIPAWRLSVGQLLTPTLLLSLMQWLTLGIALVIAPGHAWIVGAVALYVPVFSFLIVGIENLLFLLFPVRLMAATPGDFQALGRNVLLAMGKMFGLGMVATMAGMIGFVVYLVTGSAGLGLLAGWPIVAMAGMALVPMIALAFTWFDVGRVAPA